jgi:hypothetical protein
MAALGQSQTFGDVGSMSALPTTADIKRSGWHVRLVPQADSCTATNDVWHQAKRASVDDVICSHQHCWRYCQTECFHRLLINDETEAGWLLEWQIGGARPS